MSQDPSTPKPSGSKNLVLVALGSNLGDREDIIQRTCVALAAECGVVLAKAIPVESRPLGEIADALFLNTAVVLETLLEPLPLLDKLQGIEKKFGRTRDIRWGNRPIDLDIILWRDAHGSFITLDHPLLKIPHPEALERDFVLVPASQIAGDWCHPFTGKTLEEETRSLLAKNSGRYPNLL